ncbi:spondin domain-containing protein [Microvirga sp. VF16]|uniref:spondin domain-containing protein n=1 Tax=Microvirga sp. VF16 TaxID=2807101 RepID=UPI00193CA815|nr:spondin domain-containing protein [Microvirga sp. VF16]QRM34664.1 spondin domain-containing protein [Microvirga sp. VF16]
MFRHPQFTLAMTLVAGAAITSAAHAEGPVTFAVSIESITSNETLTLPDGRRTRAPISPGLYVVSKDKFVFFTPGQPAGTALESLAEDGNPTPLIAALNHGRSSPIAQPFLHNEDFTITAEPGDRLHFAVMFVQSNDLVYAPQEGGMDLFTADGQPVSGELTASVALWDAGTEVNQPPGVGSDQAPRQAAPNTGASENGVLRRIDEASYPPAASVIRVTVAPE